MIWKALCALAYAATTVMIIPSPSLAQTQQQIDWCVNKGYVFSSDQQISGCAEAIQSGKWHGQGVAWAFNNRANAYFRKSDYDHALADYNQAIKLDPQSVSAYDGRANAYSSKDDHDRAVAD